jgi:hypothetical protein
MSILIRLLANYLINCPKGFLGAETREHVAYGQVLYIDHTWTSPEAEALLYRRDCSRSGTKTLGRSRILCWFHAREICQAVPAYGSVQANLNLTRSPNMLCSLFSSKESKLFH